MTPPKIPISSQTGSNDIFILCDDDKDDQYNDIDDVGDEADDDINTRYNYDGSLPLPVQNVKLPYLIKCHLYLISHIKASCTFVIPCNVSKTMVIAISGPP